MTEYHRRRRAYAEVCANPDASDADRVAARETLDTFVHRLEAEIKRLRNGLIFIRDEAQDAGVRRMAQSALNGAKTRRGRVGVWKRIT
jgi:hypothetical protein